APRPVDADALLAERALDGDPLARTALAERVAAPLESAGGGVLDTVRAVLGSGGNLEASARALFVHPNTVRYRLKRVTELTGLSATDPRGSWTLQVALALAALDGGRSLWS
ncbi:CdaR family transcriptional regulator, partial [Klenkia sp. PcliD-1-E]|uniref:PucR family transcriptional regulator n=1 Tax=Klenkia sp. PcliD-1-E TaxID=2954492 RepID=UPI002097EFBB